MKIRIKGNSLRLRLSKSEVKKFANTGAITESIQFGPNKDQIFSYTLEMTLESAVSAVFEENQIRVLVPQKKGLHWAASEEVGILKNIANGSEEGLSLLIEKDFKCMKEREGENESDNYSNPNV